MTHLTPHKSAALFLLYEPSVTHVSVLNFMPSTSYERLCFDCWLLSMLSHIHVPPHVLRNSQKLVGRSGSLVKGGPSFSLFTLVLVYVSTDVGVPHMKVGVKYSSLAIS
jgi:hypothetical protein